VVSKRWCVTTRQGFLFCFYMLPALDEHGNPAPGVTLGNDGSITIGTRCVIHPVPACDNCCGHEMRRDGSCRVGAYIVPSGGISMDYDGGVELGDAPILGRHPMFFQPVDRGFIGEPFCGICNDEKGIVIKHNGTVRIGRLYFKRGQRVCLVAAHKAAKQRWTALRAAWVAAVCASA
jgi:hypothetical protein